VIVREFVRVWRNGKLRGSDGVGVCPQMSAKRGRGLRAVVSQRCGVRWGPYDFSAALLANQAGAMCSLAHEAIVMTDSVIEITYRLHE
jgi:hypothetical protein